MLHEPTREKLMKLRLSAMVEAWEAQSKDASITDLTFDERLALIVDSEYLGVLAASVRELLSVAA